MEIEEETDIKLRLYGYGEWIDEPDLVEFEYKGINCLIVRNEQGALCGYCQIPEGHKYFGKECEDIPYCAYYGLTFSGDREIFGKKGYWIGFDCAHSNDITPSVERFLSLYKNPYPLPDHIAEFLQCSPVFKKTYKNIAFVTKECEKLAEQIINEK